MIHAVAKVKRFMDYQYNLLPFRISSQRSHQRDGDRLQRAQAVMETVDIDYVVGELQNNTVLAGTRSVSVTITFETTRNARQA